VEDEAKKELQKYDKLVEIAKQITQDHNISPEKYKNELEKWNIESEFRNEGKDFSKNLKDKLEEYRNLIGEGNQKRKFLNTLIMKKNNKLNLIKILQP